VPAGASINGSSGAFSWTPTEAQGPGTYRFKVKVADNGSPVMSDDEEITVTVAEVNVAPVLAAIGDKNVAFASTLTFTASATDADIPANTLSYSLVNGTISCGTVTSCTVPAGASINSSSGAFSWTNGALGTYRFKVKVTDNGSPVMSDDEEITVTVSPASTTTALTLSPSTVQYSDKLTTLKATITPASAGGIDVGGTVKFYAKKGADPKIQIAQANVVVSGGQAIAQPSPMPQILLAAAGYKVTAEFTSTVAQFADSASATPTSDNLTVTKEDATVGYTTPYFVATATETATSASNVVLNAIVTQADDGNPGNLALLKVDFLLYKSTNLAMTTPDLTCLNASVSAAGLASCTVASLGVDSWTVIVKVQSNNYFTCPQSDAAVVTVYQPLADKFVTGGGWIVDPGYQNKPVAISSLNNHGNFGFNARFKKGSTTDPQGQAVSGFRGADGYAYVVTSNSWPGGVLAFPSLTTSGFNGKANVTVINPATGLAVTGLGGGNYTFRVDVTDNGSPGSTDKYALSVYTPTGALYHQSGTALSQITLGGGNIVVH
jgi:hypothetical protein